MSNQEEVIHKNACRLCDGKNLETVLKLEPTPPGEHYVTVENLDETQETFPLDIALCNDCSYVGLLDTVDPNLLYGHYLYETLTSLGLDEHFDEYAKEISEKIGLEERNLVVDFGSNDGTLLRAFQRKGVSVLGVDPSENVGEKARDSGIETISTFFTRKTAGEIVSKYGQAKLITSNNVIANIDDLADTIKGVRRLLSDDGTYVFETIYCPDMVSGNVFDNISHEHLSYLSVKPLRRFFRSLGMELINVDKINTKGGSIRGFVKHDVSYYDVSPSVQKLIDLEDENGFNTVEPYKMLGERMKKQGERLRDTLDNLRERGNNIAGYGASIGATTLIYQFGLDEYLNFLVDDNPIKIGRFSPGYHIPVFSPNTLCEKKPDYTLITAWRFAEPIMQRNQEYSNQGGHFIVPDLATGGNRVNLSVKEWKDQ